MLLLELFFGSFLVASLEAPRCGVVDLVFWGEGVLRRLPSSCRKLNAEETGFGWNMEKVDPSPQTGFPSSHQPKITPNFQQRLNNTNTATDALIPPLLRNIRGAETEQGISRTL